MKVYNDGQFDKKNGCVLALGSFESLHTAHLALIDKAVRLAADYGGRAGVHMFSERIENVIFPGNEHKSIYTNKQKEEILSRHGVDFIYFEKFDKQFMSMSAYDFVKLLKEKLGAVCVVAGFHYSFGKNAEGNADLLKQYAAELGIDAVICDPIQFEGELISSTAVRRFLKSGNIEAVNAYLGREYSLCGNVKHDRGVGSAMGIPTANIELDKSILFPQNGVYAGYTAVNGQEYPCVINIGVRPTFGLNQISVEAHIIGYSGDLYENELEVFFIKRLRNEQKFDTKDELIAQILHDTDSAKTIFLNK